MKLLIGVLASKNKELNISSYSYEDMLNSCYKYCYNNLKEDTKVYNIYGNDGSINFKNKKYLVEKNNFYSNTIESRQYGLLIKTINFFQYALENIEFDYMIRPNCGSFIDTELLKKFILNKFYKFNQLEKVYSGIQGTYKDIPYVSGSCIILSKDLVRLLVKNKDKMFFNDKISPDDVEIGRIIYNKLGNIITPSSRVDCNYNSLTNNKDTLIKKLSKKEFYHYYYMHTINPICFQETFNIKNNLNTDELQIEVQNNTENFCLE